MKNNLNFFQPDGRNECKYGKINPLIVKCLFKVVIDDIEYEISCRQGYIDSLKEDLKRFQQIEKYRQKMESAKKEKDKNYYLEGIKLLLKENETIDNYLNVHKEIQDAYEIRTKEIENLYDEVKVIKKLKV